MVRALVALAEGLSLIPSPQVVAHGHSQLQFQRTSFFSSSGLCRHEAHTQSTPVRAGKAHIQNWINIK